MYFSYFLAYLAAAINILDISPKPCSYSFGKCQKFSDKKSKLKSTTYNYRLHLLLTFVLPSQVCIHLRMPQIQLVKSGQNLLTGTYWNFHYSDTRVNSTHVNKISIWLEISKTGFIASCCTIINIMPKTILYSSFCSP